MNVQIRQNLTAETYLTKNPLMMPPVVGMISGMLSSAIPRPFFPVKQQPMRHHIAVDAEAFAGVVEVEECTAAFVRDFFERTLD